MHAAALAELASFFFAGAAPDTTVLSALEGPLQAGGTDRAALTDCLGLLDLNQCGAEVADGKEEFGVFGTAGCVMAPVHAVHSSRWGDRGRGAFHDRSCEGAVLFEC